MESPEVDIKPNIQTDDIPDKDSLSTICKLKQSRYEDVWPEDVHAAFMEAVALYPPMGKRRLKYYRLSTHENEHSSDTSRSKSFGRCQLIQSYILEKTGKNRSRKQVSSHLQRLKKVHKDNPAMRHFFSEQSQPLSDPCSAPQLEAVAISSQDIFANISFSTRHLKSDFDLTVNLQNTDAGVNTSPTSSHVSNALSCNASSCDTPDSSTSLHSQPSIFAPQELLSMQQFPVGTLRPSDSDYFPDFHGQMPYKDTINGGFRGGQPFNTSAFSISMRRLASRLPIQVRVDSNPTTQHSRVGHAPVPQPPQHWPGVPQPDAICCGPSLTPPQALFHTPFYSLQLFPSEKQRHDPGLGFDWMWSQNSDVGFGSREGTFGEHPLTVYEQNPTSPGMRVVPYNSSSSEIEAPRLPPGLSYPYLAASPAMLSRSVSTEPHTINFSGQIAQEPSEDLLLPPVISPTPIYPISYIHSDNVHTSPSTHFP